MWGRWGRRRQGGSEQFCEAGSERTLCSSPKVRLYPMQEFPGHHLGQARCIQISLGKMLDEAGAWTSSWGEWEDGKPPPRLTCQLKQGIRLIIRLIWLTSFVFFKYSQNHDRDKFCEMKSLENWILKFCTNWAATVEILFVGVSQKTERAERGTSWILRSDFQVVMKGDCFVSMGAVIAFCMLHNPLRLHKKPTALWEPDSHRKTAQWQLRVCVGFSARATGRWGMQRLQVLDQFPYHLEINPLEV